MKLPALLLAALSAGGLSFGFASPQSGNQPPDCTDQGDYVVECQGLTTSLIVSSSATDPDGDPLSYQWFSCPLAFVTDPTAQTTEIILDTSSTCDIRCGVRIQVTDPSGESTVCRLYFVVVPGTRGCSPGYWKNHVTAWADTPFAPGDDFDTVFGVDAFDPDRTLLTALRSGGGGSTSSGAWEARRCSTPRTTTCRSRWPSAR